MSKKSRKVQWSSSTVNSKRRCIVSNIVSNQQTENIFRNEDEDDEDNFICDYDEKLCIPSGQQVNEDHAKFSTGNLNLILEQHNELVHYEPILFQSQPEIVRQNNSNMNDTTFFSNSTLDILLGENNSTTHKEISQSCGSDQSILTVSTLEKLLNDTETELTKDEENNKPPLNHNANDMIDLFSEKRVNVESNSQFFDSMTISQFSDGNRDDSVFNTINLPAAVKEYESQKQLKFDNTFFANIHFDDVVVDEHERLELIGSDELNVGVQNTQRFLEDVATYQATQQTNGKSDIPDPHADSFFNQSNAFTQYLVHDNNDNSSINTNLLSLNWESEAFTQCKPSNFPNKGNFYALPEKVKQLIFEHKGIKSLYEWQDECLSLPAINKRKNLIYALPTSGGKTLVAEILMLRELLCREKDVLFILPYVSIVQEKVSAMSPFAIALNFIVEEYTAGKGKCPPIKRRKRNSIYIASIEKGAILMDSLIDAQRAEEIGMVVVDELHLIGEKGRGATLEAMLTKIMFINVDIQIVGMSATIGNLSEISSFLKADVYTRSFRPVELKEYIKCGNDILEINANGKALEEIFVYKRTVDFNYSESVARSDPDHLAGLVAECAPENSCLVFCHTRKNCENVALLLSRILSESKFLEYRKREKNDLMEALNTVCGVLSKVLSQTIPFGIAYHHSGLTMDERKFIETAYRFGVLSVICCTSTLAAGVNLPAKRVIIRAPYVGAEFLTLCKYKQMVGRAGRAGMGETGESILIVSNRDNVKVGEMLFSPMDKALSSLHYDDCLGLQSLILSTVGLEIAASRLHLYQLVDATLLAVQANHLGISTEQLILNIIREMFKHKVLELIGSSADKHNSLDIITTQDGKITDTTANTQRRQPINISRTTRFQLTTIGKAAFKAGIDYKRAYAVYAELKLAQKNLILTNCAHLLYLIVCFNSNCNGSELFSADASILYREYMTLNKTTQNLFKLLGFTEAVAIKMVKTLSIQGLMELKLNRLYKVLVLMDIINVVPLPAVAVKYNVERGMLQTLINQSAAAASAIVRLCDQLDEFWCFKPLFERMAIKIDRCGTIELEPLLDLPAVKVNRAKQLYAAGFKTVEDIAKCHPLDLVRTIEHMPMKIAKEIISAAKIILMKKLDYLEEETEALKLCLQQDGK